MVIRRTFAGIPGGPAEIHRLESLGQNYRPRNTQGHIEAMIKYDYKPTTCGKLCGCELMRRHGGGSPVWFAYRRGGTEK